ncbi:MAG TPA: DUF3592 domain-containing protein [Stellaceae bacterium]|nr:DUF3592 domain-containing protein [Stellaceae bacterium]
MRSIVICLLVIIGIAFLAWQGVKVAKLEASGIRAEGQVVHMQRRDHSTFYSRPGVAGYIGDTNYHPIVRFHTQDNQTIEFEDFTGEWLPIFPASPHAGKTVTVLYLANDPKGYAIIDRGPFWNWVRVALSPSYYFR